LVKAFEFPLVTLPFTSKTVLSLAQLNVWLPELKVMGDTPSLGQVLDRAAQVEVESRAMITLFWVLVADPPTFFNEV